MDTGEVILWAAIFGLLMGIIWSLKYIVIIERRIARMEAVLLGKKKAGKVKLLKRKKRRKKKR